MNHIERAFDGQNQWWKYIIVIVLGFFGGQALGIFPALVLAFSETVQNPELELGYVISNLTQFGYSKNVALILMLLPFVMSLVLCILTIKKLHGRSFSEVTNGTRSIRWGRIKYSFALWLIIIAISLGVDIGLSSDSYKLSFDLISFSLLVLISLIIIPLQTSAEELLFRGYLFQAFGVATNNRIVAALLPGILFGLMHAANPEVAEYGFWLAMPHYVLSGIVFGLLTALDDGMELALGAHAANNIFISIFVTEKSSVFQTDALITAEAMPLDLTSLFFAIGINVIFIFILHKKYKFNWNVLSSKIR